MSATAAVAATTASTTAANAAAQRARTEACNVLVKGYQHDAATEADARQYAECVRRLYPEPITSGELMAAKAAIVILFLCAVIGAVYGWREDRDSPILCAAVWGLGWLCGGALAIFLAGLAVMGVQFLLT